MIDKGFDAGFNEINYNVLKFMFIVFISVNLIAPEYSVEIVNKEGETRDCSGLPLVINTWAFTNATKYAWCYLYKQRKSPVDTVEAGCSLCEEEQCGFTVGFGGSPDEKGETTLDAMIMDGNTMDVGAVGSLRRIKNAAQVARHVLDHTRHSILVGKLATNFALSMGFSKQGLSTNKTRKMYKDWERGQCQPNFWKAVKPSSQKSCGPYKPLKDNCQILNETLIMKSNDWDPPFSEKNHDTIGMIAVDRTGGIAVGTSSNGAKHKIPGRIGDATIPGAGGYADASVGAAIATGDGDIMIRFLPSFLAIEEMRRGATPTEAAQTAIRRIAEHYPRFVGALIAVNMSGVYGVACNGMKAFPYSVMNPKLKRVVVNKIPCDGYNP